MKKSIWFFVLCIVLCCLFTVLPAAADFGSFSGDADYGGDFSFDYGYDDYNSYDSYDAGYVFVGNGISDVSLMDVLVVIVVILLVLWVARRYFSRIPSGRQTGNAARRAASRPAGASRTDVSQLRSMEEFSRLDPEFDDTAFQEKLSNLYVQMQNCWTDRDLESLRPYFTDAIFTQMDRQVQQMKQNGRTNYVDRISVLGVELRGFFQRDGEDHIIAELRTRIVDYTKNDATGEIISGSETEEKFMTYEWELTRTSNASPAGADGETRQIVCPSCGAPVDINASARCEFCGTVLEQETHTWAISAIKGLAQVTR